MLFIVGDPERPLCGAQMDFETTGIHLDEFEDQLSNHVFYMLLHDIWHLLALGHRN